MKTWEFEPGHTEARFKAKHMMVTWVNGLFKNISGTAKFDPESGELEAIETKFDAKSIWTGVEMRDDHLRSADFLDVEHHPEITFTSKTVKRTGANQYTVIGDLTLRGKTKEVALQTTYLGTWNTVYWVDDKNLGPIKRVGFSAKTKINRHDFGVSWQDHMDKIGGVVVSDTIAITLNIQGLIPPKT